MWLKVKAFEKQQQYFIIQDSAGRRVTLPLASLNRQDIKDGQRYIELTETGLKIARRYCDCPEQESL